MKIFLLSLTVLLATPAMTLAELGEHIEPSSTPRKTAQSRPTSNTKSEPVYRDVDDFDKAVSEGDIYNLVRVIGKRTYEPRILSYMVESIVGQTTTRLRGKGGLEKALNSVFGGKPKPIGNGGAHKVISEDKKIVLVELLRQKGAVLKPDSRAIFSAFSPELQGLLLDMGSSVAKDKGIRELPSSALMHVLLAETVKPSPRRLLHRKVIERLLKLGANPQWTHRDGSGSIPELAKEIGDPVITKLIEDYSKRR